jgi:hypothetical protein
VFDVFGTSDRPDIVGDGFFILDANRLVDFEFTIRGRTWTEADVPRCQCVWAFRELPAIVIGWRDGADFWRLIWDFRVEDSSLHILSAGIGYSGSADNGTAF